MVGELPDFNATKAALESYLPDWIAKPIPDWLIKE